MNQGRLRRILILVLAAAICLEMVRFVRTLPDSRPLTLWYVEADFPQAAVDTLVSRCRAGTGLRVEARSFESEDALGDALEEDKPDLLFCTWARAETLYANGGLASLPEALPLPDILAGMDNPVGTAFFPLGGRVPLLLSGTALEAETYTSMERLLHPPHGGPHLVSDDIAEILYTGILSLGGSMDGDLEKDLKKSDVLKLYNSIALSVLHGTLAPVRSDAAEYVLQGRFPCAVVSSADLADLRGEALWLYILPLPLDGSIFCPAELFGFALPEGARTTAAESFLRWLWTDENAGEAAYAAGLVPAGAARDASGDGGLDGALYEIAHSGLLAFPAPDGVFYANRQRCEESMYRALDMLT